MRLVVVVVGGAGRGKERGELHAHLYNTPVVLSPPSLPVLPPSPLTHPILNCSNEQINVESLCSRARAY